MWWAAAVPLLLLVLLGLCEWQGWPFLRGPLERRLAQTLERDVSLGPGFQLRLLGPVRLRTDELSIGPPHQGPFRRGEPGAPDRFLNAHDAALVLSWKTLLGLRHLQPGEPIEVRSLDVTRLDLVLLRHADGRANWQSGVARRQPDRPLSLPEFEQLVVRDATLRIDDAKTDLQLDARVSTREGDRLGGAPGASAPAVPASGASAPVGATGLQARASGHFRDSTVQAELATSGLLPLVARAADAPALPFDLRLQVGSARLELDGQTRDVARRSAVDAPIRLSRPTLAAVGDALDVTLPNTLPFDMNGRIRRDATRWTADVARLSVGSSRLAGEFAYDLGRKPPLLTGALRGQRLHLPDLAPAFGHRPEEVASAKAAAASAPQRAARAAARARAASAEQPADAQRRVLPQHRFDLPSLAVMDADVRIALDQADLGTEQVAALAPLNGHLRLKDRVLTIENLLTRTSGGELRGTISMDAREKVSAWAGDLRWAGVRLERFVRKRPSEPIATDQPGAEHAYVSGVFGGNAKLTGRGNSAAAMLGSLDGATHWWVRDGRISHLLLELSGIDIAESLGVVVSGDETLPVGCAVARLGLRDGVATFEAGVVDTKDTTLLVAGGLSLADETLGIDLRARPKDYSLAALRSPVHIRGTFAKPEVGVDKTPIALRLGAAAALAAIVTPLAGVLALIDLGDEEKAVCQKALEEMAGSGAPKAKPQPPKPAARP
jgi:uncharacterized protein involved in outer membrane biogenesis